MIECSAVAAGKPAAKRLLLRLSRSATNGIALFVLIAAVLAGQVPRAEAAKALMLGAWLPNGLDATQIKPFQQMTGRRLDIVAVAMPWAGSNGFLSFNVARPWAYAVYTNGSVPLISWEPMVGPGGSSVWPSPLAGACPAEIASAPANSPVIQYIANYAFQVAAFKMPVLIRMLHEANYAPATGGWYWGLGNNPYCGTVSDADFVGAWRRIVGIFQWAGATNAKFVWCINWAAWGVNDYTGFYPGDDVVSYAAIDGYNWGGASTMSFDQIFANAYAKITAVTTRPILIGEWASAEYDANNQEMKAAWIQQSFATIESGRYPQIAGLLWFNQNETSQPPWPVNSSTAAANAYATAIKGVPLPW